MRMMGKNTKNRGNESKIREPKKSDIKLKWEKFLKIENGRKIEECKRCGSNHFRDIECPVCSRMSGDVDDMPGVSGKKLRKEPVLNMEKMAQCSNCGSLNPKNVKFCIDCQAGMHDNPDNYPFLKKLMSIAQIQEEVSLKCENCGVINDADALFCSDCLYDLFPWKVKDGSVPDNLAQIKQINSFGRALDGGMGLPGDENVIICHNCSACNEKINKFCKDCTVLLERE
jgi:hypothetical protein